MSDILFHGIIKEGGSEKWQNYRCAVRLTADYALNAPFIGAGITIYVTAKITGVTLNRITK
jgi:hypothetical protein